MKFSKEELQRVVNQLASFVGLAAKNDQPTIALTFDSVQMICEIIQELINTTDVRKQPKINLIYSENWCGMYIDGRLQLNDHSLDVGQVLSLLGYSFTRQNVDDSWLEDIIDLPQSLNEIPADKLGRSW